MICIERRRGEEGGGTSTRRSRRNREREMGDDMTRQTARDRWIDGYGLTRKKKR